MDIALLESFALAEDRAEVVRRMIPGTDEHLFLRALLLQQRGELAEARKACEQARSFKAELLLRQRLLEATDDGGWEELGRGFRFDHRCNLPGKAPPLPARLPAALMSVRASLQRAQSEGASGVAALTQAGLCALMRERELQPKVRRWALERAELPLLPGLIDHIVADLGSKPEKSFGNLAIHKNLTLEQMDELARRAPSLLHSDAYVGAYLSLLDADPQGDELARLGRKIAFVEGLPQKASGHLGPLYQRRVELLLARDEVDREGLLRHLQLLPRPSDGKGIDSLSWPRESALWRVLQACLASGSDDFRGLLSDRFLRKSEAEARLLAGDPDPERWASQLDASQIRELRDRVDLALAPCNPARLGADDDVRLQVDVKNVEALVIRVFHVDPVSYYRSRGALPAVDIDLDGFVPNAERTLRLDRPPAVRHRVAVGVPEAKGPGLYVVDLVGGGLSCRALLHKGHLRALCRVGAAGHVLTILDELGRPAAGATAWLGDRAFSSDAAGEALIPFVSQGEHRAVLLSHGPRAGLEQLSLASEGYELQASFHVEREDLLPGAEARVLVRARLLASGGLASASLIEGLRLMISATCEGVTSERAYDGLRLDERGEALVTFTAPRGLELLSFALRGEVTTTLGQRREVQASTRLALGSQRATQRVTSLFLTHEPGGWGLLALGRAGEPRAGVVVSVSLTHHASTAPASATLQTDERGAVALGPLPGVTSLQASADGAAAVWNLSTFSCRYPAELHLGEGERLALPVGDAVPEAPAAALFEVGRGRVVRERSAELSVERGAVVVAGLPAGEYLLSLVSPEPCRIRLVVSSGARVGGFRLERDQALRPAPRPPARLDAAVEGDSLRLSAQGASRGARFHVFATALAHPLPSLRLEPLAQGGQVPQPGAACAYASARELGDEARYILQRRGAARRAGNMLPRPSLLLSPWAVGETSTEADHQRDATRFSAASRAYGAGAGASYGCDDLLSGDDSAPPDLDFLLRPAAVVAGIEPDAEGNARVPLSALEGRGAVRVLLIDGDTHIARRLAVGEASLALRELRVKAPRGDEPEALRGEVTALRPGDELALGGARYRVYDTLDKAWSLLESLDPERRCTRLDFLRRWPALDDPQKQKLYSEWACCELNFFLYRKDRPFFERVVRPHLSCKRQRVFLDDYLLDRDLSGHRAPAAFARLNGLERVLLAERLGELDLELRAMSDLLDAQMPEHELEKRLFRAALQAGSLSDEPEAPEPEAKPEPRPPRPAAPALKRASRMKMAKESARSEADEDESLGDIEEEAEAGEYQKLDRDVDRRAETRHLYRPLDATREHAEQHYFRVRLRDTGHHLAPVNAFWRDLAAHRGPGPFLSRHVLRCTDGAAAMILALAVLDLPWSAEPPALRRADGGLWLSTPGPALVFSEQARPLALPPEPALLVTQHYLDPATGEPLAAQGELLCGRPYQCRVIVSNPSHYRHKFELQTSLPEGAIPLRGSQPSRSERVHLSPYETRAFDLYFYFPLPGSFSHPLALAADESLALSAPSRRRIQAAREPSSVDTSAWGHLSQAGSDDEVIEAISTRNLHLIDLDLMAFRLQDRGFYGRAVAALERRRFFHATTWSYALKHRDAARAAQLLEQSSGDLIRSPLRVDAPWLAHDPHERGVYEHLEYMPLVNARAHGPSGARKILNNRLAEQVERLMVYLCSKPSLGHDDQLSVVYYLLLQDRVDEARERLARVDPAQINATLQHDYARAYLAFDADPALARAIAARYAGYPVDRWRDRFCEVLAQLDEIEGQPAAAPDPTERDQRQGQLAATQPSVELLSSPEGLLLRHRFAPRCEVSFYEMDLELLFSQRPFSLQAERERPPLKPGASVVVEAGPGEGSTRVDIPPALRGKPLLVEAACGEARSTAAHTAGSISVQLQEAYGQLRALDAASFAPLPRVYVKVYAQDAAGRSRFHKDGYTDPRGRFDYASVSDSNAPAPRRFALLLLCDQRGAAIREVNAPTS